MLTSIFNFQKCQTPGSKARTGSKRSTWKLENKNLVECPHCHEMMEQHKVCSNCGYYNGKQVVAKKED